MFGNSPSSLDAAMYGYLGPLLKAPFPNNTPQNYLKNCSNLVKFVVRISHNYFPKVVKNYEERSQKEEKEEKEKTSSKNEANDEEEEPLQNETRNKVVFGCLASVAMAGYAYKSGLVDIAKQIEFRFGDDEEEDYEEE